MTNAIRGRLNESASETRMAILNGNALHSTIVSNRDSDVIFIRDRYNDSSVRSAVTYAARQDLRENGISHYLTEAPTRIQEVLNKLGIDELSAHELQRLKRDAGPGGMTDTSFLDSVQAMARIGLKIVAIVHPDQDSRTDYYRPSLEESESFMYERIRRVVDGGGRPIVIAGTRHASILDLGRSPEGVAVRSAARRLMDDGYRLTSIDVASQADRKAVGYSEGFGDVWSINFMGLKRS